MPWNRSNQNVAELLMRHFATKPKPKMKPIELNTPPEQTQTITRVIFDVLKEHGPLTIAETWDRVKVHTLFTITKMLVMPQNRFEIY